MLIEQLQEGAVTVTTDGNVFYCNRRMAEMLGTPQERVIGQQLQPYIRRQDRAAFQILLADACHGHARTELTLIGFSGIETPVTTCRSARCRTMAGGRCCAAYWQI